MNLRFSLDTGHFIRFIFLYDLYVMELLEGQIPEDAMYLAIETGLGNPVVIHNLATTTYNYKPFDVPLVAGKTYIWCVVARDANNLIQIVNDGRRGLHVHL